MIKVAKGFLSGVKWQVLGYKLLVYGMIVVGVATISYHEGLSDCKIATLEKASKENAAIVVQEREFVREALAEQQEAITKRLTIVDAQTREGAKLRADLVRLEGELYEIINARSGNPACAPTSAELRVYDSIAERTRK